jgi:hypothetical protein
MAESTGFLPRTGLLVWQCHSQVIHRPHDYVAIGLVSGPVHCPGVCHHLTYKSQGVAGACTCDGCTEAFNFCPRCGESLDRQPT